MPALAGAGDLRGHYRGEHDDAKPGNDKQCVHDAFVSSLIDVLHAAAHEVHQKIIAKRLRRGEVGLAAAHGADLLDELHEREVVGEHEGVDHHAGTLAAVDLFERFGDHDGV